MTAEVGHSEKRRIVELSLQKNSSVQEIAKQFKLDAPTLSSWRTLYRQGKLQPNHAVEKGPLLPDNSVAVKLINPALLPVTIADSESSLPSRTHVRIHFPSGASVHIETEVASCAELGALLAMMQA